MSEIKIGQIYKRGGDIAKVIGIRSSYVDLAVTYSFVHFSHHCFSFEYLLSNFTLIKGSHTRLYQLLNAPSDASVAATAQNTPQNPKNQET